MAAVKELQVAAALPPSEGGSEESHLRSWLRAFMDCPGKCERDCARKLAAYH